MLVDSFFSSWNEKINKLIKIENSKLIDKECNGVNYFFCISNSSTIELLSSSSQKELKNYIKIRSYFNFGIPSQIRVSNGISYAPFPNCPFFNQMLLFDNVQNQKILCSCKNINFCDCSNFPIDIYSEKNSSRMAYVNEYTPFCSLQGSNQINVLFDRLPKYENAQIFSLSKSFKTKYGVFQTFVRLISNPLYRVSYIWSINPANGTILSFIPFIIFIYFLLFDLLIDKIHARKNNFTRKRRKNASTKKNKTR